ncbi:MAG TPA: hypothetical protein VGN47_04740 [Blastococcus sp.]|jgi:hypothetical protein|nr:hypothetical protein [Blastococcus sp.]
MRQPLPRPRFAPRRQRSATRRRLLIALVCWVGLQAVLGIAGRLAARRLDEGGETSRGIRRVKTLGGVVLRPTNPELMRVRLDLGMAGGELDLTGVGETTPGVDLTVRALMGGLAVRVPAGWRVWWSFRGVGGIGTDLAVARTHDEHAADLRVHARALFGGIGIEAAEAPAEE